MMEKLKSSGLSCGFVVWLPLTYFLVKYPNMKQMFGNLWYLFVFQDHWDILILHKSASDCC